MSHHYSGPDWAFPRGDARLDLADLYAFPKPHDASKSIFVMNVHPSYGENPRGPTSNTPFAPEALYELKIDSDGDSVADIAYRVRFSRSQSASQVATLCRAEGRDARAAGHGGQKIVEHASISMGQEARITEGGDHRFFAGWRSDPFFFDRRAPLTTSSLLVTISSPAKMCAAWCWRSRTRLCRPKPLGCGTVRFFHPTDQAKVGCKWSAERGRFNSSWFLDCPLRRVMPTLPASLRTTPSSFLPSRTRWSTLAAIHRNKRRASQRRCCQRCLSTIHRVRRVFPSTEGRSLTTPLIRSSRFSQMER